MKSYYEKQFCWWVLIVIAFIVLVVLVPKDNTPYWVLNYFFPIFTVFFLFVFVNFFYLTIRIEDKFLDFGFGIFRQRIRILDVASCKPHKVRFGQYLGYGIRFGFDNSVAYTIRNGSSIRVELKNKKIFVINTKNPEQICAILK